MPMGLWKSKFAPSPPEITDEARIILRRVGLALIGFGLLDIGVMVYCIANGVNYSSSFNVFAVLAGIYVRRGHAWWVKWTMRAAGFYAAAFCVIAPIVAFLFPRDLGALEFRLHPVGVMAGAIASISVIGLLIWVYSELRQAPVLSIYTPQGYSSGPSWRAPVCDATLALGVGVLFASLMHGDAEQRAITLATAKMGPGYHYFVTSLSYTHDSGSAEVLAYDDRAVRTVKVEW
jgi:hypothetical protein